MVFFLLPQLPSLIAPIFLDVATRDRADDIVTGILGQIGGRHACAPVRCIEIAAIEGVKIAAPNAIVSPS